MAIAPKIKHVDPRPNGVLRFRRRFPKDVAEALGQKYLQVHIRNRTGVAFHQEYQAILREFDRIVRHTRETSTEVEERNPIERWHDLLMQQEKLVTETYGLDDDPVGDPRYPYDLLRRVITVSLETVKIVKALPKLDI